MNMYFEYRLAHMDLRLQLDNRGKWIIEHHLFKGLKIEADTGDAAIEQLKTIIRETVSPLRIDDFLNEWNKPAKI